MASEQPVPWFFLLLMAAAGLLMSMVIRPIASELFLAAVLAAVAPALPSTRLLNAASFVGKAGAPVV